MYRVRGSVRVRRDGFQSYAGGTEGTHLMGGGGGGGEGEECEGG